CPRSQPPPTGSPRLIFNSNLSQKDGRRRRSGGLSLTPIIMLHGASRIESQSWLYTPLSMKRQFSNWSVLAANAGTSTVCCPTGSARAIGRSAAGAKPARASELIPNNSKFNVTFTAIDLAKRYVERDSCLWRFRFLEARQRRLASMISHHLRSNSRSRRKCHRGRGRLLRALLWRKPIFGDLADSDVANIRRGSWHWERLRMHVHWDMWNVEMDSPQLSRG
ncbi:hypothetical protein N431DRAFT_517573, partial [Stipitochalara longipes BDJ]